jgi:predicted alpha/beta-hydrolase family hydrolase
VPEPVAITVYSCARATVALVLAHGAGAGQSSSFITRFARGMVERSVSVATFDFPYMAARRKVPDKAEVLEACWRGAIGSARSQLPDVPLFIGGKSMGGRIASQVAAQDHPAIAGLVYLGYPLHPPGKPQQRRDAHLPAIAEPMLFVQGSRDAFGTADEIRALLPRLPKAELFEVGGGDHSFKVTGRPGVKPNDVMEGIMDVVARFMGAGAS